MATSTRTAALNWFRPLTDKEERHSRQLTQIQCYTRSRRNRPYQPLERFARRHSDSALSGDLFVKGAIKILQCKPWGQGARQTFLLPPPPPRLLSCCLTSTEASWPIRDGDRVGRGRQSERLDCGNRPKKTGETVDRRQNSRCPLAIAQRLVHCAIAVSAAVLDRVTKTMSVAPLLTNNLDNLKQKDVQLAQHSSTSLLMISSGQM